MDLRNLVGMSPFMLFEATGDSDQVEELLASPDLPASMDLVLTDQPDDDAESCSYGVWDRSCSSSSSSCVSDDFNGCDDGYDEDEQGEVVEEGRKYWPCEGYVGEEPVSACVDSDKEVTTMNEMEKSRLFWETCLAS